MLKQSDRESNRRSQSKRSATGHVPSGASCHCPLNCSSRRQEALLCLRVSARPSVRSSWTKSIRLSLLTSAATRLMMAQRHLGAVSECAPFFHPVSTAWSCQRPNSRLSDLHIHLGSFQDLCDF